MGQKEMGKGKGSSSGKGNFPSSAPLAKKKFGERNQVEKNEGGERNQETLYIPVKSISFALQIISNFTNNVPTI